MKKLITFFLMAGALLGASTRSLVDESIFPTEVVDFLEEELGQQRPECEQDGSKFPLPGVNRAVYHSSHQAVKRHLCAISFSGDSIELDDGSIWSVDSSDRVLTLNWYTGDFWNGADPDEVFITQNLAWFSTSTYRIINCKTGTSVATNLSWEPLYNGRETNWIKNPIDQAARTVCLQDDSLWQISWFDRNTLAEWCKNDIIILGINDSTLTKGNNPNILINVTAKSYVIGECINNEPITISTKN